ncbi:hypothetical protein D9757_010627 [Collybiopsis confluens]|uniref:Zn(2)-C6 fungal-type domain-containing protein n=1 Tax=Collybiopsis confluens TaxID=2823264 RepID=A0A8H5GSF8_9AGAR|nr:hypothetical protein D9757_010627 [Collybiopsis confluens]
MSSTGRSGRGGPSRPRGPYTARGLICTNCRRRKIKCDGVKPVCSQCKRSESAVCEYMEGNAQGSELQALEANLKILQARIRELEVAREIENGDDTVRLHEPYPSLSCIQDSSAHSQTNDRGVESIALPFKAATHQCSEFDVMFLPLMEIFLRYARELGFFLSVTRFQEAAILPTGSPGRPSEGLLSVISLLGYHLSGLNVDPSQEGEKAYLNRALIQVVDILPSSHPNRTVHAIQAEILLAMYFFRYARLLEGKYHLHAALSIAFAAKLHTLHSELTFSGEVTDRVTQGERINAFWMAFTLSGYWAVATDVPQNIILESLAPVIDTPWPLDMALYEQGHIQGDVANRGTITSFLEQELGPSVAGVSRMAMYAKSSMLYVRAATLAGATDADAQANDTLVAQVAVLDGLLASFKSNLPSLNDIDGFSEEFSFVYAAHLITNVAIITLNSRPKGSSTVPLPGKILSAAEESIDLVSKYMMDTLDTLATAHVNPIFAPLWLRIGQVLIDGLDQLRRSYDSRGCLLQEKEAELNAKTRRLFVYMATLPVKSLLNDQMLSNLQSLASQHLILV